MKGFSTLLVLGVMAALVADTAEAQTSYVRYEQAGQISWGELDGSTIRQLSDAPYLGGTRTGQTVMQSAVTMKAPVDPTLDVTAGFDDDVSKILGHARQVTVVDAVDRPVRADVDQVAGLRVRCDPERVSAGAEDEETVSIEAGAPRSDEVAQRGSGCAVIAKDIVSIDSVV